MRTLYLCGAGNPEGVRLAITVNRASKRWDRLVVLDDDASKHGQSVMDVKIAGPFSDLARADAACDEVSNMVARTTAGRRAARRKIEAFGLPFAALIDPGVNVEGVEYDGDVSVYLNATFCAGGSVGKGSVVFTGAVVGHGCTIGPDCVLAPGAVINARVQLGEGVYVGTNASILPDLKIGAWATVGSNSSVIQDVPAGATVIGVPAQVLMQGSGGVIPPSPDPEQAPSVGRQDGMRTPQGASGGRHAPSEALRGLQRAQQDFVASHRPVNRDRPGC